MELELKPRILRTNPSSVRITNKFERLPDIKKGQRKSPNKDSVNPNSNRTRRKVIEARSYENARKQFGDRANESSGGKRHRKTAKRRRTKKSCGFFW